MIPVRQNSGAYERIGGNPTLTRLDGEERAPLQTLLHESWTDEQRAAFGIYKAQPFSVPSGKRIVPGAQESFALVDGVVKQVFAVEDIPPRTLLEGVEFLSRVTAQERAAIKAAAAQNADIDLWLEIFRLRGEIDVAGSTAIAAKVELVAAGLLTQERADIIFAPVQS